MKFQSKANVLIIDKEERTAQTTGKTSYYVSVAQKAEAGTMSCTEDVFKAVQPMTPYTVVAVFDDKYGYCRIVGAEPANAVKK